jgi:hypothetical protein
MEPMTSVCGSSSCIAMVSAKTYCTAGGALKLWRGTVSSVQASEPVMAVQIRAQGLMPLKSGLTSGCKMM